MKSSFYIKILGIVLCAVLLGGALCLCVSAASVKEYSVTVDHPVSTSANGMPAVLKNYAHGTDPVLTLAGWIKTDQTIRAYEYTMDGGKTWHRSSKAIQERPDVKSLCPDTYKTAGFHLEIDVSDLPRGTYDVFVRAYTDRDDVIEVLAMLDVTIGQIDTQSMAYREINLDAFGAKDGVLTLEAGAELYLDAYHLRAYRSFEVLCDKEAVLTLAGDPHSVMQFSASSSACVQNEDGTYAATIALDGAQYAGKVLLWSTETVHITRMRFYTTVPDYYKGELTVHMTATPYEYLGGANGVEATVMADDTVGTYTRLFPAMDTGDPYIYFSLGNYLKETQNGMQITADHYRYAVMTLQTPSVNPTALFRLFLCAGDVHGPTGGVDVAFQPINDGKWHTYVIPLCDEEQWMGTVYGMRFDFIDDHANPSHYANIASLSFHPDEESARKAAAQPFTVHHEQGKVPEDLYREEGRAPSGRADAITWFDQTLSDCFGGENKSVYSFDEYGHLILQATETFNDPFVSFSLQTYSEKTGLPMLRAEDYGVIVLRVLADKKIEGKGFTLYYYADGLNFAQGERAVNVLYDGGEWEYLIYDMAGKNVWAGEILGMRLDYAMQISAGQRVCLSDMLFFKDMEAWVAHAEENGIEIESDLPPVMETDTLAPETELPTIEIPTEGPGLEYVPPHQFEQEQNNAGCQSVIGMRGVLLTLSALLLMLCLVACVPASPADREQSTAQAEASTGHVIETNTDTGIAETTTEPITDTTTDTPEEQTTFGELHFPESGE